MRVEGLNQQLDELIEGMPDSFFRAGDEPRLAQYPELSRDPYQALAGLRDRAGPVLRREDDGTYGGLAIPNVYLQDESHPMFVVLGYDALAEIVRQPEVFHNGDGAYGAASELAIGKILTFMDGEEHDRQRRLMLQAFGRPAVKHLTEDVIGPIAEFLVERLAARIEAGKPADLSRDLAVPLTFKVMSTLLGLPQERFIHFVGLGSSILLAVNDPAAGMRAAEELAGLYGEEVEKRRRERSDDLISWLVDAEVEGRRYTDEEIITHARFFLPAGIDTTWRQIGLMVLTLLSERDRYQEICKNEGLIQAAVEECNRYASSGFAEGRRAMTDTTVAGIPIPAGSSLVLYQGLANRDPARWKNPDVFDMHRPRFAHVLFNAGPHSCLGQHLATLELQQSLRALTERLPSLRLAVDPREVEVVGLIARTPVRVPVTT
jgi:cytochrome P450